MNLLPTECAVCETEVAVEYDASDEQASDLCERCGVTVCCDCVAKHAADGCPNRAALGVDRSMPNQVVELMERLGFELVDVFDGGDLDTIRAVFRTYPFRGDLRATKEQLAVELFTTVTFEDTTERPR